MCITVLVVFVCLLGMLAWGLEHKVPNILRPEELVNLLFWLTEWKEC